MTDPNLFRTLTDAERFVAGFAGDELQTGIDGPNGLLTRLRSSIAAYRIPIMAPGVRIEVTPVSRYAVQPERDLNSGPLRDGLPEEGTHFEACPEEQAQHWAVYSVEDGESTLIDDFQTRAAAEAYVRSMEAGERLQMPADLVSFLYRNSFAPECAGGGGLLHSLYWPTGWRIWITGKEGGCDGPYSWSDWMVGVYSPAEDCEGVWTARGDDKEGLTLRQAVAAAIGLCGAGEALPEPVAPAPQPAAIAFYLDKRHEAAILAALRLVQVRLGEDSLGQYFADIMANDCEPLTASEVGDFADALGSDTWLCEAASGPEAR